MLVSTLLLLFLIIIHVPLCAIMSTALSYTSLKSSTMLAPCPSGPKYYPFLDDSFIKSYMVSHIKILIFVYYILYFCKK